MDNFQSILVIIGIIAIIGVSIHGFLTHRKEKRSLALEIKAADKGMVNSIDGNSDEFKNTSMEFHDIENKDNFEEVVFSPDFDVEKEETLDFTDKSKSDYQEPELDNLSSDEIVLENDMPAENENETILEGESSDLDESSVIDEKKDTDIFIFNVVAKNEEKLGGHELLQYFLTSGFRFGEMSIFHRHEHSDGTGPVLFSISNMMAPGVFDLDTMEQFKSEGVSFFLSAPNDDINIRESFKMMLTAVEIMAEEFDCIVLNGEREALTEAQFIEYQDRLAKYN